MKTHIVIDLVYHEDEGNEVFEGTLKECLDWVRDQEFGYQVLPKTKEQLENEYFIGVDPANGDEKSAITRFKKHPDGRVEVLIDKK